jgi:predicted RND superfamily exporter protein
MEEKYLKDFVIALVVIFTILFIIKVFSLYSRVKTVPEDSIYKELALGDELLENIHNLENSIKERKEFIFTVNSDPLEQNLIVKTIQDLQQQWKEQVESMVRLESTIVPESGKKKAVISHKGETKVYEIGDKFSNGTITDIKIGEIVYKENGKELTMKTEKLPEKPKAIQQSSQSSNIREYNW